MKRNFSLIPFIATTILCLIPLFSLATVINVPDDFETIQEAIDESEDSDTVLVDPGEYEENVNFNGNNVVVGSRFITTGDEDFISETIIDGGGYGWGRGDCSTVLFSSGESAAAQLIGFTIRNGYGSGPNGGLGAEEDYCYGGGIFCDNNSNPTLSHLVVTDNEAFYGGGICTWESDPALSYIVISNNRAAFGGGVHIWSGNSTLDHLDIHDNDGIGSAMFMGDPWGYQETYLTLINSTISRNTGFGDYGTIYINSGGQLELHNTIIWDNDDAAVTMYAGEGDAWTGVYFSDIEGGEDGIELNGGGIDWGEGNIDVDPLFVDPENGDYHLTEDSPCIDVGDPESDLDPDSTRADMGAYYFFRVHKAIPRNKYFMFGIPCLVNNGNAGILFQDDYNNADPGYPRWRVSRYDATNGWYERYGEGAHQNIPDCAPGLGFWMAQSVVANCVIDILADQFIDFVAEDQIFSVPIDRDPAGANRGLTQIANPFHNTYDWSQTTITHSESGTVPIATAAGNAWMDGHLYVWDPDLGQEGAYIVYEFNGDDPKSMDIWLGGWVESYLADYDLTVNFNPAGVGGVPRRPGGEGGSPGRDDDEGWALQLALQSIDGGYVDMDNRIAVNPASENGWDLYDAREFTPMSSGYAHLYFDHEAREFRPGKYTWDYRSMDFDDEKVWEFTVKIVNLPDREFVISCPNIGEIDYHYFFSLENEDGERLCDLRETEEYTFESGDADTEEIDFRLVVAHYPHGVEGESDLTVSEFGIISVTPNPFNSQSIITYVTPKDNYVRLSLYDITGRYIRQLTSEWVSAGRHQVVINGEDLAAGAYIVRFEAGGMEFERKIQLVK